LRIERELLIPLFLLTIANTLTAIDIKASIPTMLLYILFFILVGAVIQIKKLINNKNTIAAILLIFSIVSTVTSEGFSVVVGIFYLSYSLFIVVLPQRVYFVYGVIYIPLLMINFFRHNYTSAQSIGYMAGILFVFIIYRRLIHPKKHITKVIQKDYLISPVKKEVVDIVHLIIEGCEYHEINDKLELNITADRVRRKVNEEIKRLGFKNREHMIFFLTEKGIIKSISYDLDIKNKSHDIL
jgi:hypothetical protein